MVSFKPSFPIRANLLITNSSQESKRPHPRRAPLPSLFRRLRLLHLRPHQRHRPRRPVLRRPVPDRRPEPRHPDFLPALPRRPPAHHLVPRLEGIQLVQAPRRPPHVHQAQGYRHLQRYEGRAIRQRYVAGGKARERTGGDGDEEEEDTEGPRYGCCEEYILEHWTLA
jgi:hypothetical protein